jgi:hypothetical protein
MPVSKKQLAANRQNAKKSKGPKTPQGKKAVRLNALKHGLYAKDAIIKSANYKEDPKEYNLLLNSIMEETQPVGLLEESLVYKMVNALWRSRRAIRAETSQINQCMDNDDKVIDGKSLWQELRKQWDPRYAGPPSAERLSLLIEHLKTARGLVNKLGEISDDHFEKLFEYYPLDEPAVHDLYDINKDRLRQSLYPERNLDQNDAEEEKKAEARKKMLALIDKEIEKFTARVVEMGNNPPESEDDGADDPEKRDRNNKLGAKSIPDIQNSHNILRYEMRLDRQFNRALKQLHILQNRREKRALREKNDDI